ncbi:MAG: hypothetical protein ABJA62_01410 [Luteimonas sp.]
MIIRRIGVLSAAKIVAIISAAIGLIAGLCFFAVSSIGGAAMQQAGQADAGMAWMSGLGALAIVVMPILYGIIGFIGGAIEAFIFNIATKFVGGLQVDTE